MDDFELNEADRQVAARIPRTALEQHLAGLEKPSEKALNPAGAAGLRRPLGVFITLKNQGRLRGCVGHIHPLGAIWQELRDVAILSATRDTRFEALKPEELEAIDISITLLSPPRYVEGPYEFEVGVHGIIFELGAHRAVFLPQVAPQWGWGREATFQQLARKAGLKDDAWKESDARFALFRGQVFDESGREQKIYG